MKINQLKAGAALSYISMGLGYIISLIYTPVMIRLLGQSEYGLYNLVASVVSYLGLLNFGFGSAYIRYYSRFRVKNDQESVAKLNGMFLIVFSVIGFIAALAGMVLTINTGTIFGSELTTNEIATAKVLMGIMVVNIAFSFPNVVFNSYVIANEQFIFQKLLNMIKTVANPFLVLPMLLAGYGSVGMVIVTTVLNVAVEIANIFFCLKKLNIKFLFHKYDFSLMKEMSVFSFYIFINMVVDEINWNVDKFILGRFHGTVSVAVYGIAAQLNVYYKYLSTTVSQVFIPRVNKIVSTTNDNNELTNLFTKVGRIQFILLAMISIGFLFFGERFIIMWAGINYKNSFIIAVLLILPVTIPLIQNVGIEIQRAKNMHKFRSWTYLFIAIANIFISLLLVENYGGIGTAAGTAISLIIGNVFIMNWYYHKKVGLDMLYFWRNIISFIPSLIIPIIIGCIMFFFLDLNNTIVFFACGSMYVLVYCISVWCFGMNQYEKDLVTKPLASIFKRVK